MVGGGAGGVVPLMEDLYAKIVDSENMVPHSCIDPTRYYKIFYSEVMWMYVVPEYVCTLLERMHNNSACSTFGQKTSDTNDN